MLVKSKLNNIETLISQALNEIIMKWVMKNFKKFLMKKKSMKKWKKVLEWWKVVMN